MDRKTLFKSNIIGNTAMRKNRVAKANSDRNLKRKELFSRGRDIKMSPEQEPKSTLPASSKKGSKKVEEIIQKEQAHKARFQAYMEEKRKRLEREKGLKKPPFISAVGGSSVHNASQKPFEFAAPKAIKGRQPTSKSSFNDKKQDTAQKTKILPVRATRSAKTRVESQVNQRNTTRPRNLRINKKNDLKTDLPRDDLISKETPLMKDKVFVFNSVGTVLTSTARKHSVEKATEVEILNDFENALSPIDGIAPLETSVCAEEENKLQEQHIPHPTVSSAADSPKTSLDQHKTPPKQANEDNDNFYVSPFVTTSRGKGSAKKEHRNRESVYKLELNQSIEEPLEVRRRREAVRYFRKILSDEINRLSGLCKEWETYRDENADMYEEHCTDLINTANGQTKLLITGKLKQFEKLIDDCEKYVNNSFGDKLTAQQNVSPEDLEGFWNYVKIQVENVDRRFNNLIAWRNNNWVDPEEKPKIKKNLLAKSMKPKKVKQKMKPAEEVRSLIRKLHRECLKNKVNNKGCDQDIIFVSRRSQNGIKDNMVTPTKPIAPVAPRIIKTPYRVSAAFKENRTPNVITPAHRRLSMLKKARGSGSGSKFTRRLSETPKSTTSLRKSILKSESKSTRKKSVLFSEQIQYKSPERSNSNFRSYRSANGYEVDDFDVQLANESDESLRVMELRTRKVLMRDDISDFL